jgi:endonuclease/exonuclease/phosphatase (EEP) superfamily protein YafD
MNGCFQANILAVQAVPPRYVNLAYIWGPWPVVRVLSLSDMDLSTHALTAAKH